MIYYEPVIQLGHKFAPISVRNRLIGKKSSFKMLVRKNLGLGFKGFVANCEKRAS